MITVEEWDRVLSVVLTGRTNVRVVRCAVQGCRRLCAPGTARRIYIDGHPRGFVCPPCRAPVEAR